MTDGMLFSSNGQAATAGPAFDADAVVAAEIAKRQTPYKLLKIADILAMEDPESLIESMVPKAGMTVLFGPSGTFKSFVALDWALCVAAGVPWFGRKVQQAPVVYVAGEGLAGIKLRLDAWLHAHPEARPAEHFHLVPNAVNLLDTDDTMRVHGALEGVRAELGQPCGLLIVDTMARALVGGDENSARDVGLFIANVDEITRPLASLVVHHTGKDGAAERGSSALRGAADSMVKTERSAKDKRKLTLKCAKSKDAEEFEDIPLVVVPTNQSITFQIDLTPAAAVEPEDDLKQHVLMVIARSDRPLSLKEVRRRVKGSNPRIDEVVKDLEFEDKIERTRDGLQACPARRGTVGHAPSPGTPEASVPRPGGPRRGSPEGTVPEPHVKSVDQTVPDTVPDGPVQVWPCEQHDDAWSVEGGPLVCGVCHPPSAGTAPVWVDRSPEADDWEAQL